MKRFGDLFENKKKSDKKSLFTFDNIEEPMIRSICKDKTL